MKYQSGNFNVCYDCILRQYLHLNLATVVVFIKKTFLLIAAQHVVTMSKRYFDVKTIDN